MLINAVSDHAAKFFGNSDYVYHEQSSSIVHIDIHRFGPNPATGLVTFVTTGMAEKAMVVPPHVEDGHLYRYAELVLQMPASLVDKFGEPDSWPIDSLRKLARMPHLYETWLYMGHTVGDDPGVPFPGTKLSIASIWPTFLLPDDFTKLTLEDGREITFLTVAFLHDNERKYSKEHYQQGLMEEIVRRGHSLEEFLIFNPDRPSLFEDKPKRKFWSR